MDNAFVRVIATVLAVCFLATSVFRRSGLKERDFGQNLILIILFLFVAIAMFKNLAAEFEFLLKKI